jgi:hypothetical protein
LGIFDAKKTWNPQIRKSRIRPIGPGNQDSWLIISIHS